MSTENTSSPSTRDRGLRRLNRLTMAVSGGAVAALGAFAYTAAATIPGSSGTLKVAAVSSTSATSNVDGTTTTTTPTPTATPTPTPTASSKPVAVSGGSK
jgi:hypothetical protein